MQCLRLIGVLIGFLLVLMTTAQEEYTADDGFFSMTIPDGWMADTSSERIQLTSESTNVTVYLVTQVTDSATSAIEPAMDSLGIVYGALVSEQDAPLPNGVWRQHIYSNGGQLAVTLAQVNEGRALVMIVTGEQADIQSANPQILNILNSIQLGEGSLPAYVDTEAFTEREVTFGNEPFILNGTLSLPTGESTFPAVVIVHGSGPNDRNGTLGTLAAYRDIAQGLASQGILVLRYDKRTLTYGATIQIDDTFTVDAESTDDAVFAVEFLKTVPEVDSSRIFVLGHSQGASVTPRILQRSEGVRGGILLAGATRSFADLVREQIAYITEVNPDAMTSPAIVGLQTIVANYDAVTAGASYEETFGEQAEYFQSLAELAPLVTAQAIEQPLLILQGERDYQVTMVDFGVWQEAFADSERVSLKSYPALNHQFMSQGETSRLAIPQDYEIPDFVSAEVIQDIADWIDER